MIALLRRTPLRLKLVAAVLALVVAALLVISAGSAVALRSYLLGQTDVDLTEASAMAWRETSFVAPEKMPLASDYFVVVTKRSGAPLHADTEPLVYSDQRVGIGDLPRWPASADEIAHHVDEAYTARSRDGGTRWRVLVTAQDDMAIIVGRDLEDVDKAVARLVWIDVLVGGVVLVLLAAIGAAIVRTSLRPLVEIERTAAAIADGDLTRRVPDPEPGPDEPRTELGRLSRALNAMLSQIEAAFTARAASETAARAAESAARDAAIAAQASEARARRSEERMRQFVADASHELRTPLTSIRGFAELYRQGGGGSPEDQVRLVRRIEDEAARMGLLVEDLLLLARLDRERPVSLAPVEVAVLAMEAVQAARAVAPDRSIELDVPPGAGGMVVLGDDARLRQVLGNLLTNALVHTPSHALVSVRLRSEPSNRGSGSIGVVEVADTGPGLSRDQADRVFERFYRADAARTRRSGDSPGTGLGLAIVAAIVAAHHGSVEVQSEPGMGTTFRVRLPLVTEPDGADPPIE